MNNNRLSFKNVYSYILQLVQKNIIFIKYCIIGVTGVLLDFSVFTLLTRIIGVPDLTANAISITCGITNNFILNAFLNFKVKRQLIIKFFKFYSVGLIGLGISTLLMYLLIKKLEMYNLLAKGITIVIVTIIQFNANKFFTFKKEKNKTSNKKTLAE